MQKTFGARPVLRGIELDIEPGAFVAIVGRSGCGKSTLLRMLAGLETPTSGSVRVDGAPVAGFQSHIRLMFQDPRLLPWRSVRENVALGLGKGTGARAVANSVLDQVGLGDRAWDWPSVLSGGQRQRVALARALAAAPKLLLLDEPLGALDALTRREMQDLISRLWLSLGFTAVLVTHDPDEAVALADRIIVLRNGAIESDLPNGLPRPRARGREGFASLSERVLESVLQGTN